MTHCASHAEFDDAHLLRYSRHILLDELGVEGQEKLLASRVLIVGAGGLGSPAAIYLAAAGIGHITLIDDDTVDLTNLQRQIAHTSARIGEAKAQSAAVTLLALNPEITVTAINQRADGQALLELVGRHDLVLDCSDNFATRHAVNRACVTGKKPLVSGAAVRFTGQITVFDPRRDDAPCYHCLFGEEGEASDSPCATFGVFAPLTGIIGSQQAAEALKVLAGIGEPLLGRLQMLDALTMRWREVRYRKDPACPICSASPSQP